jgi:hypothetical protein
VFDVTIGVAQARLANLVRDGSLSETWRYTCQGMDHQLRVGSPGGLPSASPLTLQLGCPDLSSAQHRPGRMDR